MFEALDMTPRGLYKEISTHCQNHYDTLEYYEKSQYIHVIKLTRSGKKNIEVVCSNPYENSVSYRYALETVDHIKQEYPEQEMVWWL